MRLSSADWSRCTLTTRSGRAFIAAEIEDLTGSIEVTVWPETYESTRDFWRPGEIIVASVRIRDNNDRLRIAVQRVQKWGGASFDPQTLFPGQAPGHSAAIAATKWERQRQRKTPQRERERERRGSA